MFSLTKFVIKGYINQRAWEQKQQGKPPKKFEQVKAQKEEYDQKIKPIYEATQQKFNQLCKERKIESEELYLLRVLIEECLGTTVNQYKGWKFKNEFHRIYTYLKCWELDKLDFIQIQNYLDEISHKVVTKLPKQKAASKPKKFKAMPE